MTKTLDYHLTPVNGAGRGFRGQLFERGNTRALEGIDFDYDLSFMTDFEISRLHNMNDGPWMMLERLKTFGQKLYHRLFPPGIEKLWREYKMAGEFLVLCIRTASGAGALEMLPWECLYDGDEFIAAGANTGMTRLPLEIPLQKDPPPVVLPIRMLALLSSPVDLKESERLLMEKEQEILQRAVDTPAGQGKLLLVFEDEAKRSVIENALEGGVHILHYSGHGIPPKLGGGLLLEDAEGKKEQVPVPDVMASLEKGIKSLRLVVLSGCHTAQTLHSSGFRDLARALVERKVPAVIAMQFSITDEGAMMMAESLYPALAAGKAPDIALSAARRKLILSKDPMVQADALAPVLFLSADSPLKTRRPPKKKI